MAKTPENSALEFLSSRKTLVMATAGRNGAPNASYAPFVQCTPWLYVYTSTRSKHTKNMTETTRASVIFIGPRDSERGDPWSRTILATILFESSE